MNTGLTPSRSRCSRTSASVTPPVIARIALCTVPEPPAATASLISRSMPAERSDNCARRASEKPIAFKRRIPAASLGKPLIRTSSSAATISCNRSRNHGSNPAMAWIRSTVKPWRSASAATSKRSGVARASALSIVAGSACSYSRTRSSPVSPVSSPRSAFCRLSAKLRPIAITSPTDFIEVDSSAGAPLNFSNAKRGILVTT